MPSRVITSEMEIVPEGLPPLPEIKAGIFARKGAICGNLGRCFVYSPKSLRLRHHNLVRGTQTPQRQGSDASMDRRFMPTKLDRTRASHRKGRIRYFGT